MVSCSITNLASCLPEKFLEYFLSIFNAPVDFLLNVIKGLIAEPVDVSVFHDFWLLVVYILSFFYIFLLIYAGFTFVVSGHDVGKREKAKLWLRNIIIMVVLVSASYLIYGWILDISSIITSGMFNLIPTDFFQVTADNIPSLGLQLLLLAPYILMLCVNLVFFALRYLIVAVGVALFPIGIFFYFIPPLEDYGKLIVNCLMALVFIPIFQCLILLASSKLLVLPIFADLKILVMISAFTLICLSTILVFVFIVSKSTKAALGSNIGIAVTSAVKYFV